jgi:hypothetical protein
MEILDLNSDVNFSFLNFENFLIIAFALHTGIMSKGIGIVFAQNRRLGFRSFTSYKSLGLCHEFE